MWEKFREKVEENLLEAKGWKEVVLEKSRVRTDRQTDTVCTCCCHGYVLFCSLLVVKLVRTGCLATRHPGATGLPISEFGSPC